MDILELHHLFGLSKVIFRYVTTLLRSTVRGDSLTVECFQLMRFWRLVAVMLRGLWVSIPYLTQKVLSPDSLSPVLNERVFWMANSLSSWSPLARRWVRMLKEWACQLPLLRLGSTILCRVLGSFLNSLSCSKTCRGPSSQSSCLWKLKQKV